MRVERGVVRVEDARVSRRRYHSGWAKRPGGATSCPSPYRGSRTDIGSRLAEGKPVAEVARWLTDEVGIAAPAAEQLAEYLAAGRAALGELPHPSEYRAGTLLR